MQRRAHRARRRQALLLLVLALPWMTLSACRGLGPASLGAGRGAYNDVIARTNSEQMLELIVRLRYADPIALITVSNVTANLRFGAQAAGEAGIGADSAYAGNLVPFSAGLSYEESPTITYAPANAQAFLRAWLRPLPLEIVIPSMQAVKGLDGFLPILVERMNGLRSGAAATPEERAEFARMAALLSDLRDRGMVAWLDVSEPRGRPRYEMIFFGYAPEHTAEVADVLRLVGLPGDTRHGAPIRIPVEPGVRIGRSAGLFVQARSVSSILGDAAALVEVPEEAVEAGVVAPNAPAPDSQASALRIRSSRRAPGHANVAVKHRGWWYYVDDGDLAAKKAFQAIEMLFVSQLAEATRGAPKPVLTIPVK